MTPCTPVLGNQVEDKRFIFLLISTNTLFIEGSLKVELPTVKQ